MWNLFNEYLVVVDGHDISLRWIFGDSFCGESKSRIPGPNWREARFSHTAPFLLFKIRTIRARTVEKLVEHGFSLIGNSLNTCEKIFYIPYFIELYLVKRKA